MRVEKPIYSILNGELRKVKKNKKYCTEHDCQARSRALKQHGKGVTVSEKNKN